MRVLVACEFSGVVRNAFIRAGYDAISCDLLASESPGPHIQGDIRALDFSGYDLMIAHPPCKYLTKAGAGNFWNTHRQEQREAFDFVMWLWDRPVPRICIENPAGFLTKAWRHPDQYLDPFWFGHDKKKHTGLWLKNLPPLMATLVYPNPVTFVHGMPETKERWKKRSRFFPGMAEAMAVQWGCLNDQ